MVPPPPVFSSLCMYGEVMNQLTFATVFVPTCVGSKMGSRPCKGPVTREHSFPLLPGRRSPNFPGRPMAGDCPSKSRRTGTLHVLLLPAVQGACACCPQLPGAGGDKQVGSIRGMVGKENKRPDEMATKDQIALTISPFRARCPKVVRRRRNIHHHMGGFVFFERKCALGKSQSRQPDRPPPSVGPAALTISSLCRRDGHQPYATLEPETRLPAQSWDTPDLVIYVIKDEKRRRS